MQKDEEHHCARPSLYRFRPGPHVRARCGRMAVSHVLICKTVFLHVIYSAATQRSVVDGGRRPAIPSTQPSPCPLFRLTLRSSSLTSFGMYTNTALVL